VGDINSKYSKWNNVSRVLKKAYDEEKGFIFWNTEVAGRKSKLGIKIVKEGYSVERRYICPDCVASLFTFTENNNQ
jgi:hypothetical protein